MSFTGTGFLFRFLPIFLILYLICPKKQRGTFLVLGSLLFYGFTDLRRLALLLGLLWINYTLTSNTIKKQSYRDLSMLMTGLGLIVDFGVLVYFKFTGYLPLGISFFTFQMAALLMDARRGEVKDVPTFTEYTEFICMFPKLISGPIASFGDFKNDRENTLKDPKVSKAMLEAGFSHFVIGMGMKLLLADRIGSLWNTLMTAGAESLSTPAAWMGALGFSMQLYFDFCGYSLMAIGLGEILGFHLPENFRHPYLSTSVSEFWRRWHITLGAWFRKYIYIPLGGNRKGFIRTLLNLFVVWVLTAAWHGTTLNFAIWGLGTFLLIMLERIGLSKLFARVPLLGHIWVILSQLILWTVFAIPDLHSLTSYLGCMFGAQHSAPLFDMAQTTSLFISYSYILAIGLLFCTDVPAKIYEKYKDRTFTKILLLVLFALCCYEATQSVNNPFLYFSF